MDIILAAIDGTNSWQYFLDRFDRPVQARLNSDSGPSTMLYRGKGFNNTSFVYKFFEEAQVGTNGRKEYFEGPDITALGLAPGRSIERIVRDVFNYVKRELNRKPRPVVLIGHSRGGHAAIAVAHRLKELEEIGGPTFSSRLFSSAKCSTGTFKFPVVFLGLYDAVKRAVTGTEVFYGIPDSTNATDRIPDNVLYTAHAVRDPEIGSRWWFGNTGRSLLCSSPERYHEAVFPTTHGRIGGSPVEATITCSITGRLQVSDDCTNVALSETVMQYHGVAAHRFVRSHFHTAIERYKQ